MTDRALQAERDTIRIPLYQESPLNASSTHLSAFGQGQQFINCIPEFEINPVTKEGTAIIQKRPGIKATGFNALLSPTFPLLCCPKDNIAVTSLIDVNCCAIYDDDSGIVYIFQYRPTAGTLIQIGSISTGDLRDFVFLSELIIAGVPTLGVVWTKYDKSQSKCYYATSAAGVFTAASLTQIVDASFPDQIPVTPMVVTGRMVQMNFTTYVLTTSGYLYNSDQYSISSWDDSGNIQTYAYPDKGIGLIRYKNHIVAFSEDSIEFFNDVGNKPPGTPLERTQQAFIKFGCIDPQAMINVDDVLYWIAASSNGTDGLWKLEGYTPVKITNPQQDMQIGTTYSQSFGNTLVHLRCLSMNGTTNILVTGVLGYANVVYSSDIVANDDDDNPARETDTRSTMLAYCTDYQTWWSIFDHGESGIKGWLPCGYSPSPGTGDYNRYKQYLLKTGGFTSLPEIYVLESTDVWSYFKDQTATGTAGDLTDVQACVQFHPLEFQTLKRKFMHRLSISMEPIDSAEADSWMYIIYSKDENTGGDPIVRNCQMNPTTKRYYINRLGLARRVQFALVNKSNHAWILRAAELEVSQGMS